MTVASTGASVPTDEEVELRLSRGPPVLWAEFCDAVDAFAQDAQPLTWVDNQQIGGAGIDGAEPPRYHVAYPRYSRAVERVLRVLRDLVIFPFDWPHWGAKGRYLDGARIEGASVADAARLATALLGEEHYVDGVVGGAIAAGSFGAMLRRIRRWHDEVLVGVDPLRRFGLDPDDESLPAGVRSMLAEARADVLELLGTGVMHRAEELAAATGVMLDATRFPRYFAGDPRARVVLVHLDPKCLGGSADAGGGEVSDSFIDFADYALHQRFLGYHDRRPKPELSSGFDIERVRFLAPFIPVLEGRHERINAERAVDNALQLALVPYAFGQLPATGIAAKALAPHLERVLDTVAAYPREYVLLCGEGFDRLMADDLTEPIVIDEFELRAGAGRRRVTAQFARVALEYRGTRIDAGLALSYAHPGLPMDRYGEECQARYHGRPHRE
ncbi:MAG: DUF6508 domain-containing protein [Acidimicrobiales bacterium]